jgi:hypothetical protein
VIVPHYRDLPALELCPYRLDRHPRKRFEIIVADNGACEIDELRGLVEGGDAFGGYHYRALGRRETEDA